MERGFFLLIGYPWTEPYPRSPQELGADGFQRRVPVWLAVVAAIGVIEALYGAYQVVAHHPQIFWLRKTAYVDSATGTFVYRGHLAGYLEMAIPITLGLALAASPLSRPPRPRRARAAEIVAPSRNALALLLAAATALMLLTMGLTQSRGGVLSCLGGLAIGATVLGASRRQLTPGRVAAGAVTLIALAVIWLQSPQLMARFGTETRLTPYARPSLWYETLLMARDFPLMGIGLGNFEFVFPHYQPVGTATYFDHAHNDYLQLLAETGALGAACFAWLFLRLFVLLRRRLSASEPATGLIVLGLSTGIIALLLHSFTDFNLHMPSNVLLFVMAFGVCVRLLDQRPGLGPQDVVPLRSRMVPIGIIVAAALTMVMVGRTWWVESVVRSIFPNTSLVNPLARPPDPLPVRLQRVEAALRIAPGQVEVVEAVATFARQLGEDGTRERAYLASERLAQQTADAWAAAARAYRHMIELRPSAGWVDLWLGQAVSHLAEVRYGFAVPPEVAQPVAELLDRATRLQPRDHELTYRAAEWAVTHWGLLAVNDRERAAAWVRGALTLDPLRARELLRLASVWDAALPERLAPDDPEVRLYLAFAYDDAGRADDAARVAAALETTLVAMVQSPAARFVDGQLLGRLREFRGNPQGAAEAYTRASLLAANDSDRAEACKRSGYNWLGAGDTDKAEQALNAARRYGGRDPDVLTGLSAVYERRGDYAAAARLVRDAVAVAPGAPDYRYRLARLYERAGEYGKANEQFRRLLDGAGAEFLASHRTAVLLALAQNYRHLGLVQEARRFYELVLQDDSQNSEARDFVSLFGP